ncbi:MAG: aldo/keto reductase [Phycisphaerales bacterium]|nr:aldo/keto reductase [Phycisphaerales bacterium]
MKMARSKLTSIFALTPSHLALGTVSWGTKLTGNALDAIYAAYRNAGGNVFDSAHVYAFWLPDGHGSSERALGQIVRKNGDRNQVLLTPKGGHPTLKGYERPDDYLSPRQIKSDVAESLDRLGFDTIDLYYLHRDDPRVPVGEIIDALHEHVAAGRLKAIGASNWNTTRIAEANAYAIANNKTPFAASQPKFSLAVAKPSKDPLSPLFTAADAAWHAKTGLPVFAYSSTANGYFATGGNKGAGGCEPEPSAARLHAAERIAADIGATPNQVALAWLMQRPFPVVPILGTGNLDHLKDALGATKVNLSGQQIAALTGESL